MSARLIPPPPTEEDERLIRSFIVHGIMLSILKRDIRTLHKLSLHMPDLYIRSLSLIEKETSSSLWNVRRELRTHGIRILQQTRTSQGIEASYQCRGYERTFSITWEMIREESIHSLYPYSGSEITAY